jgi:hypothetical protein
VIGGANAPLARAWNWPYLEAMARPISAPNGMLPATPPKARAATVIVWSAAVLGALAVIAAAALWIYYGTTVFFEMIAAGIAACF